MVEDAMGQALAGMAKTGNPRVPMDRSAVADFVDASAESRFKKGEEKPRYAQHVTDPAFFPTARPQPVFLGKAGARYGIRVNVQAPVLHEAGATQANGRIISNRGGAGPSFWGGTAS